MANDQLKDLFNKMFEDKNNNGVPDMFEQQSADGQHNFQVFNTSQVNVNGKQYNSIDELPPEIKEKLKDAFAMFQNNKWMKKVVNGGLSIMPEMGFTNEKDPEVKSSVVPNNLSTSTEIEERGKVKFSIDKKWLYALGVLVLLFVIYLLQKK